MGLFRDEIKSRGRWGVRLQSFWTLRPQGRRASSRWPAGCVLLLLAGCSGGAAAASGPGSSSPGPTGSGGALSSYILTGDVSPVHDPSIIRQGSTYYAFSTDANASQGGFLPIRCSTNKVNWTACGFVFSTLSSWITTAVPGVTDLWAPDISYFNGL